MKALYLRESCHIYHTTLIQYHVTTHSVLPGVRNSNHSTSRMTSAFENPDIRDDTFQVVHKAHPWPLAVLVDRYVTLRGPAINVSAIYFTPCPLLLSPLRPALLRPLMHPPDLHAGTDPHPHSIRSPFSSYLCPILSPRFSTTSYEMTV